MDCRLFGTKPLAEPMLTYCQLDPMEQTSMKFERNTPFFIHKNAFKNVSIMAAILSRPQCVKRTEFYSNQMRNNP